MQHALEVATDIAYEVGGLLRERWGTPHVVTYKGPIDLVTDVDLAAEAIAVRRLRDAFPEHGIVSEESHPVAEDNDHCWYLDPLDGTTNFAHGHPQFAVSIALYIRDRPAVGVVYDPVRDELYSAARGAGATLNRAPIHVSTTARLEHSLLASGFPYDRRERAPLYLEVYEQFLTRSQGIRRAGSAALDLCYVACGRVDGYWEWLLKPWDTAAGTLIVSEAGGRISTFQGGEFHLRGNEVVAVNPHLHNEMIRLLSPFSGRIS